MKKSKLSIGIILSLLSAFVYAFTVIIEKKYISDMSSEKILFLMYLGAGIGLYIIHLFSKKRPSKKNKITTKEVPKIIIIILCELISSFLIIEAIKYLNTSLVSLLEIFEIAATSICAYFIFNNPIDKEEKMAIVLVLIASFLLNYKQNIFDDFGIGSFFVILACIFWGISNNVTALISEKEPAFFTSIKCTSVAVLYLLIIVIKSDLTILYPELLLFGFLTYGLGILFYAMSTRYLGASRSTLIFSFCPIFGVILSIILYGDKITTTFIISFILMVISILLVNKAEN